MQSYRIHLIRHGRTIANELGQYAGTTDTRLSPDGRRQLGLLLERYEYPLVELLFSSPLTRCADTAAVLYPSRKPVTVAELAECNFGRFEGKTFDELSSDPDFVAWSTGKGAPPDGEDMASFARRVTAGMDAVLRHMSAAGCFEAAAVTHGGVIMTLLSCCGFPRAGYQNWMADNGKGYTIQLNPQMWMRDRAFEILGYLPHGVGSASGRADG